MTNATGNETDLTHNYFYDDSIYEKGDLLYYIVYPILVPVGVIGNFMSFVIFIQLSQSSSFFLYLSILSLSDLAFIIVGAMMGWIEVLRNNLFYEDISSFLCSAKYALVFVFSQFSSWIIVAVTVDRFIAVCFPFKVTEYCTRRRTAMTSLFLFLIICGINFPNICFKWENDECVYPEITFEYCLQYSIMIDLMVYFVAPVSLICVLNIITLRMLYGALKRRRRLVNRDPKNDSDGPNITDEDSTKQTIAMLLVVSGVYVITSLPMAYGSMIVLMEGAQHSTDADTYLVNVILELSNTINHSTNFILYGISGSTFRQKLFQMLRTCLRRQKDGKESSSSIIHSTNTASTSEDDRNRSQSIATIELNDVQLQTF
ncbi:probable G-protein coupled receptor 139 [Pecten maximus]|uniref:probable G-protein coupled receptor 139 n=1 Tax=Pecten maximus TaxID=6579 RepID=UPI001458B96F|nr:probable G-protein coupled receptor 139 [Pecten maximus]